MSHEMAMNRGAEVRRGGGCRQGLTRAVSAVEAMTGGCEINSTTPPPSTAESAQPPRESPREVRLWG